MIQIKTEAAWVQTMMAGMFFCGWFSWDLSSSPWSFWSEWWRFPKSDWCEVGDGEFEKEDILVEAQNLTFLWNWPLSEFMIFCHLQNPIFSLGFTNEWWYQLLHLAHLHGLYFCCAGSSGNYSWSPRIGLSFQAAIRNFLKELVMANQSLKSSRRFN